jgi:hypothetical protein
MKLPPCPTCQRPRLVRDGRSVVCIECDFAGVERDGQILSLREAVGAKPAREFIDTEAIRARRPRCMVKTCRKHADENRLCFAHLALWRHAGSPADVERWARSGRKGTQATELVPEPMAEPVEVETPAPQAYAVGCRVADCGKPTIAHGLCPRCYQRWRTHGKPDLDAWLSSGGWKPGPAGRKVSERRCKEPGCEERHYGRGWCRPHYNAWYQKAGRHLIAQQPAGGEAAA